jgi:acyl dehydratase
MLNYETVKNWDFSEVTQAYTRRDTILYALGLGLGSDPMDEAQLRFVHEKKLQAMPTMATVLAWPESVWSDPRSGAAYAKMVHGEQNLRIFKPLPPEGAVRGRDRIVALTDLGAKKGATATVSRNILDAESGDLLAEVTAVNFLRGDGGFSEISGASDPRAPGLPAPPDRPPDIQMDLATLPQAALIYRLNGDYNPLHADPASARANGFERPILHGLCSFGMAAYAVLRACCESRADALARIAVRFTAPVLPGDTLHFSIWRESAQELHFRVSVEARRKVVLDHGIVELNDEFTA